MTGPLFLRPPGVLVDSAAARVSLAPATGRLSLRARGDLAPLEAALGVALPGRIGLRTAAGEVQAMRLGPDEWVIHAPDAAPLLAAGAGIYDRHPHSLVDISGREVTLVIEGPGAADLLAMGIARDVAAIPVGEGRRTVCDWVNVILWRDAPDRVRLDIWHSFAPHLLHLFETGCRELVAEGV